MNIIPMALGLTVAMLAVGIVILGIFGTKNVISGKHETQKILSLLLPAVIFGISYAVTGSLNEAGMLTAILMLVLMGLMILVSGLRSVF